MSELIKINYDSDRPTVLARDLHEALEVKTAYKDWFPRMCEYGFTEGIDFNPLKNERVQFEGNRQVCREVTDHQLTIPMAKELCMLQRNDKGKMFRQYFIQIEESWNSPDMIMKRALEIANSRVLKLESINAIQEQQIAELKPKADYTDRILQNPGLVNINQIAKDYGMSARMMNKILSDMGVQYKQGKQWLLYKKYQSKGYTSSETINITRNDGSPDVVMRTKWTQKGRLFIYELLKKDDIRPLVETEFGTTA